MEKLSMCRICLVEDVRMYVIANKSLQEVYEKLTDIPFVTEDRRPMLACFHCCTKLKQCCQQQRKCVEADEVLAQMLNEKYEQKPVRNHGHKEFVGGFIITPIESISIVDDCQIGSDAVKHLEVKMERLTEEHDPENLDISHLDVDNVPAQHSESDSEDGELVMEFKIEGEEEQELSQQKQRVRETESVRLTPTTKYKVQVIQETNMEKLSMCRICLVEDVRMYVISNKSLQEVYEKLTDIPFVTEDRRPMLACFYCCTKLKQCCQLQRKCVEAEEVLAQMLNEKYEQKPVRNHGHKEFVGGFIITPIESINIVDDCQIGSDAVKHLEVKMEHLTEEHDPENLDISHLDVDNVPAQHPESDSEDGELVMEFKIEGEEEQELSQQTQRVRETESAPAAKKTKLVPQKEDTDKSVLFKHMDNGQQHSKNTEKSKNRFFKSINKTEKTISSRTVNKGKPKVVTNDTICNNRTKSKENTASLQCDKINKDEFDKINSSDIKRHSLRYNNVCAKDRPYTCDICQKSFYLKSYLYTHIRRTHSDEKPYKCNICQSSFSAQGSLKRHIRIHTIYTGEKPFKCDICQKSFSAEDYLKRHIRIHSVEKPYKCDICQRSFGAQGSLKRHIRIHTIHTGEKPYKCDICQKSFSAEDYLKRHIRIHSVEKPYKCDICQRSFSAKGTLKRHIRIHTGEKPYKCDICQKSFNAEDYLKRHIRIHSVEKPYKCDICQRSFSEQRTLKRHIRAHTGEKPYKCDICHRSFSDQGTLKQHIRAHTGEKPYKCDICHRSFTDQRTLKRHIRAHTGEKPYKCDICHRSFSDKGTLKQHIRIHTGEQPYKCDICHRSFNQSGALKTHISSRKHVLKTHFHILTGNKP